MKKLPASLWCVFVLCGVTQNGVAGETDLPARIENLQQQVQDLARQLPNEQHIDDIRAQQDKLLSDADFIRFSSELQKTLSDMQDQLQQIQASVSNIQLANSTPSPVSQAWACIIDPPFTEKRYIGTSKNRTAALFEAKEKCRSDPSSKSYCDEHYANCTTN